VPSHGMDVIKGRHNSPSSSANQTSRPLVKLAK